MADKEKEKAKVDLGLLEEDDEFEEFPPEGKKTAKISILEKTMTNKNSHETFQISAKPTTAARKRNWAYGKTTGTTTT